MEEKIYQQLLEKLGKTSLSERTIRAKAAQIAKKITTEEALTDDVIANNVEDLQVLDGQLSKDVADLVKVAIEKQPKPTPTPTPTPTPKEGERHKLLERLEQMEAFKIDYEEKQVLETTKAEREKLLNDVRGSLLKNEGFCIFLLIHVL